MPDYTELNLRMGWAPAETMELSLVGRNLLDNQHPEFGNTGPLREEIERSIFGKIALRFWILRMSVSGSCELIC